MTKSPAHHTRHALLLSCAMLSAAAASPAFAGPTLPQDLGKLDAATQLRATIWLQPHDPAAFDAAVQARMTRGSPLYHQWMTTSEVASYGATEEDAKTLTASLRAAGLHIADGADGRETIAVTGSAAAMASAFGTELHVYGQNGRTYYSPATAPAFKGAHAELIAGVTGLGSAPMMPYVRHPLGATNATATPASVVNPDAMFTTDCFKRHEKLSYSRFSLGGATQGTYKGPEYIGTGIEPYLSTCGYSPAELTAHYHLQAAYAKGLTGKGQTIVLVEAYGSPTILADANAFSAKFGLPALTKANLQIVRPDGQSATDPFTTEWPLETSLDVEWAHAVAPDAKIVIVEAPSDDSTELTYALHYAVDHKLGNIISNSYGYPEYAYGTVVAQAFNTIIREAAAQGIAVNVSSGDSGDFGLGTPFGAASIPADSPYATAIGGTSLNVPSDNGPVDSAWGTTVTYLASVEGVSNPPNLEGFQQGGGGGESDIFPLPKWEKQAGLVGAGRQLPDISAIADPQTGGIIVAPNYNGTASVLTVIGGTSLASPVFSGIWALAQQAAGAKLGQAAPIIAAMQGDAVTDIMPIQASNSNLSAVVTHAGTTVTYGPADLLGIASLQTTGFVGVSAVYLLSTAYDISFGADSSLMAEPGWDTATGWGSPNGMSFIRAAVQAGAVTN